MSLAAKDIAKSLVTLAKERPDDVSAIVEEAVQLMQENNLLSSADAVMRHLEIFRKKEEEFETLIIRAKTQPTEEVLAFVRTQLHVAQDAPVNISLDPHVVGGLVAEYRGSIIDASTDAIINRLTHELIS